MLLKNVTKSIEKQHGQSKKNQSYTTTCTKKSWGAEPVEIVPNDQLYDNTWRDERRGEGSGRWVDGGKKINEMKTEGIF